MLFRNLLLTLIASRSVAFAQQANCTVEENGNYYDLSSLTSKNDYIVKSYTGREFKLNVCGSINSETWALDHPKTAGAVYRGARGDQSMGKVNTTLIVRNGNPVLILSDGSPCSEGKSSQSASTAIRFICDESVYRAGEPVFIAQLPPDDDTSCAFYFEWKTHLACPTSIPGSAIISVLAAILLILLMAYIVAGVIYRRFALGYRGLDQFPRFSIIPLSAIPHYFSEFLDWLSDIRDNLRGGAQDLWPRSNSGGGFRRPMRGDGFSPLAREEEEAMFRDGPDGPDPRFSLDEEDAAGPRELSDGMPPPVPSKAPNGMDSGGVIRL